LRGRTRLVAQRRTLPKRSHRQPLWAPQVTCVAALLAHNPLAARPSNSVQKEKTMRILSAFALAMAATTQAQAFSKDCSLRFKASYRKAVKNRKEADGANYTNPSNGAAIAVTKWFGLVCGFDPKLKGKNITTIIITSILLALFSIPVLAQEEKPKLYVKPGAARRLIIQYLIDHLDRCMSRRAATRAETEAADRCQAILTEKVNPPPLSVLVQSSTSRGKRTPTRRRWTPSSISTTPSSTGWKTD